MPPILVPPILVFPRFCHTLVISGSIDFANTEYVEIFDKDYKYLYGEIDDPFVNNGTWVEYEIVDAPKNHPKNCQYYAKNITYVDGKSSKAPTSDEFKKNEMDIREYNKVDFFQYDTGDGVLTHKSTITRDYNRRNQYFNDYYGDVIISSDAHRRLIEHRIDRLDVMLSLIPSKQYSSGPHWTVIHYMNQGKCYSINGYLSITGYVLRGPGGVVRNRSEVTVAPDALRPRNLARTFGNSPSGMRGLGAIARGTEFGKRSSASTKNEEFESFGKNESESKTAKTWSDQKDPFDAFNQQLEDTVDRTRQMTVHNGFGKGGQGFGKSSGRATGLGRLSNFHF